MDLWSVKMRPVTPYSRACGLTKLEFLLLDNIPFPDVLLLIRDEPTRPVIRESQRVYQNFTGEVEPLHVTTSNKESLQQIWDEIR